jgi:FixJ family two-component response regulator
MLSPPTIAVVDDDESVRESLPDLLRELGFKALAFSSAEEFLESKSIEKIRCLLLDLAMPGLSGLELQKQLVQSGHDVAIIIITAQRDETVRLQALERGAVECLYKPFSDTALLKALNMALAKN